MRISDWSSDVCSSDLDVYGLPANWYITTGTLAIGPVTSALQYWLPNAVNSSGAVWPEMRASASRMPVTMPGMAERYSTCTVTFHCGTPSDSAASRICAGTSCSISSVVRTTTGSTMKASAIAPASAEKWPICATTRVYTNRPSTIDGADSRMSLTKRTVSPSGLDQDLLAYSDRKVPASTPDRKSTRLNSSH